MGGEIHELHIKVPATPGLQGLGNLEIRLCESGRSDAGR